MSGGERKGPPVDDETLAPLPSDVRDPTLPFRSQPVANQGGPREAAEPLGTRGALIDLDGEDETLPPGTGTLNLSGSRPASALRPLPFGETVELTESEAERARALFPAVPFRPGAAPTDQVGNTAPATTSPDGAFFDEEQTTVDEPGAGTDVRAVLEARVRDGASLGDLSLMGAALAGIVIPHAKLVGMDLRGCDLTGANLASANLTSAKLDGAKLDGARLDGATLMRASFSGASLRNAHLEKARARECIGEGADLSGAFLEGADFRRAQLANAKLVEANAKSLGGRESNLDGADLSRADLRSASLRGASLERAALTGACFQGADLCDAKLEGAHPETALEGALRWRRPGA
jgi:uncharacterized protein YjbI with pentapeptide repeats